jgi:penicillin-binding protein 1A
MPSAAPQRPSARHPRAGNLVPAVVTRVAEREVTATLRNGTQVRLEWDGMSWARPALGKGDALGPSPKSASENRRHGRRDLRGTATGRTRPAGAATGRLGCVGGARTRDGAIVSLVGGFDFNESKYNRVVQAQRQPGSAFKPFLYSAALERGFTRRRW